MHSTLNVLAGEVLGDRYVVERQLGAGGMASVVCARHAVLGHRVAVKIMHAAKMSNAVLRERFLREARTAAMLKSHHGARVMDVGTTSSGAPFIVMEYLDGENFESVLERAGKLEPQIAIDYILQACEAVGEAHGFGLIHRDLTSRNLFLTETLDGKPWVKILDFGLVKTVDADNLSLTGKNTVFGSPSYMSPEQTFSSRDVDATTDIWSLGVCLYELLSGRLPFEGPSLPAICAMVLHHTVASLSAQDPAISPELDAVVARCLEKNPKKRYQSVADFAFALESCLGRTESARRIHRVMSRVHRSERSPTLSDAEPSCSRPTPISWDSSDDQRPTREREPTKHAATIIEFGFGALILTIALVAFMSRERLVDPRTRAAAASPPYAATLIEPAASASTSASAVPAPASPEGPPEPIASAEKHPRRPTKAPLKPAHPQR